MSIIIGFAEGGRGYSSIGVYICPMGGDKTHFSSSYNNWEVCLTCAFGPQIKMSDQKKVKMFFVAKILIFKKFGSRLLEIYRTGSWSLIFSERSERIAHGL